VTFKSYSNVITLNVYAIRLIDKNVVQLGRFAETKLRQAVKAQRLGTVFRLAFNNSLTLNVSDFTSILIFFQRRPGSSISFSLFLVHTFVTFVTRWSR